MVFVSVKNKGAHRCLTAWRAGHSKIMCNSSATATLQREREREAFYILCPASSLMDVPGYVNPDKLMNVPIGFVCK